MNKHYKSVFENEQELLKAIIDILKDYIRVVKEHYYYDTDKEKTEYLKLIRDILNKLKKYGRTIPKIYKSRIYSSRS